MELYLHRNVGILQKKALETCRKRGHVMNKYRREFVLVGKKDWYMIYRSKCVFCGAPILVEPTEKAVKITGTAYNFNCKKGAAEKELPLFTNTYREAVKKRVERSEQHLKIVRKKYEI